MRPPSTSRDHPTMMRNTLSSARIAAMLDHRYRPGFTLIELLVVISIILVLAAMLIPAVGLLRDRSRTATTRAAIVGLSVAMRSYADEDKRHFYPTPAANLRLVHDPDAPGATLTMMEAHGYVVRLEDVDRVPGSPTYRALLDGWRRPVRYQLDGPVLGAGGAVDATLMNGSADRPAPLAVCPDWNPRSAEPWAYIWSLGKPRGDEATDALPADAAHWIYPPLAP
jgi:prepilin-type N-terminal cleavage/methylation domain-containing protein